MTRVLKANPLAAAPLPPPLFGSRQMRNQLQTYFLPDDEAALSSSLRDLSPSIFFIDHDDAESPSVELHSDLTACTSGFAYIWDAETDDPALAYSKWNDLVRVKSGDSAMMQFLRSRLTSERIANGDAVGLLSSGRVGMMGRGSAKQRDLKSRVYKVVSKIATAEIFTASTTTREIIGPKQLGSRVGFHAVQWCKNQSHLLRHAGNKRLYGLPSV